MQYNISFLISDMSYYGQISTIVDIFGPKMADREMSLVPPNEVLKAARILARKSQIDFAAMTGISIATIRRIEIGTTEISNKTMRKLQLGIAGTNVVIIRPGPNNGWGVCYRSADAPEST